MSCSNCGNATPAIVYGTTASDKLPMILFSYEKNCPNPNKWSISKAISSFN